MARVKICGVNDEAAFDAATAAGADWLGFVFFARSPRHVTPRRAAELSRRLVGGPLRVGLFVAPTEDDIARALDLVRLDALQIYGPPALAAALRQRYGVAVWRAVNVAGADDLPLSLEGADGLVIEPRPPAGATRPGGNAASLDWSMLPGWRVPGAWLLAGGLTAENVAAAVASSGAAAVDVSSGVERAPGVKDAELIRRFVAAAHAA